MGLEGVAQLVNCLMNKYEARIWLPRTPIKASMTVNTWNPSTGHECRDPRIPRAHWPVSLA